MSVPMTPALNTLCGLFNEEPEFFDIRFVGGCVRDMILGETPKDIDLCTDADPDQQMAIYRKHGIVFYETGLKHGTLTVNLGEGEIYEITSLRGERNHDGRHAEVFYHRDWEADQERRDLTMNSMMMDFTGRLYDPFGGQEHVKNGVIAFVGDPDRRVQEDYLRILRAFRFHGRFGQQGFMPKEVASPIYRNRAGLEGISRERVWSEVSRIISGRFGPWMISEMMRLRVAQPCGLPHGSWREIETVGKYSKNPVTLMVAYLIDPDAVDKMTRDWKWSGEEAKLARFLAERLPDRSDQFGAMKRLVTEEGFPVEWVRELAAVQQDPTNWSELLHWTPPVFPLKGKDLIAAGMQPGPLVGQTLAGLRTMWCDSSYTLTAKDLLDRLASRS